MRLWGRLVWCVMLGSLMAGGPARGVYVDWAGLPLWTNVVIVPTNFSDTNIVGSTPAGTVGYVFEQFYEVDTNNSGFDFSIRVTEFVSELPQLATNGTSSVESYYDHVGDSQGYTTNILGTGVDGVFYGPRNQELGEFGDGNTNAAKPFITFRDYTRDSRLSNYIQVEFIFHYALGVTNVGIQLYDVDWRGGANTNTGGNNEQDIITELRGEDLASNRVALTAEYQPWTTNGYSPAGSNSYLIGDNGTTNLTIVARAANSTNLADALNPTNGTPGFTSANPGGTGLGGQGYGNVMLTNFDGSLARVVFNWGANPGNPDTSPQQSGWGFGIGAIYYDVVVPEPGAVAVLGMFGAGLFLFGRRLRRK